MKPKQIAALLVVAFIAYQDGRKFRRMTRIRKAQIIKNRKSIFQKQKEKK